MRLLLLTLLVLAPPAFSGLSHAQNTLTIDFGDDTSVYANNGACEDSRFAGEGMAIISDGYVSTKHDASDCRASFEAGRLSLAPAQQPTLPIDRFGDDASQFANDGECDDMRFVGKGMTSTPLLQSDIGHDATDCWEAMQAGELRWKNEPSALDTLAPDEFALIDFGDDASQFAHDGECDDRRFIGEGMTTTTLLESDVGHDATDCRTAMEAGQLTLKP